MKHYTASGRWTALDGERSGFLSRCETYAKFTLPYIFYPNGHDHSQHREPADYQSFGAQVVNHIANKLVMTLFSPSRPFFRLDPTEALKEEAAAAGIEESEVAEALSLAEKSAVKKLDETSSRPKMYEEIKQLVVVGNTLMDLSDEVIELTGLRDYVIKRDRSGKAREIIQRYPVLFVELSDEIKEVIPPKDEDSPVVLYKWYVRKGKTWTMTQAVDEIHLPAAFSGKWTEEKFPLYPLTWVLPTGNDYGVGLVEEYEGDFAAISSMSQAQIEAAIMASEFRWLVDPASSIDPQNFNQSRNGEAMPGRKEDLHLVSAATAENVRSIQMVSEPYFTRIGRGFLLSSAITRDAERVTAEEIRQQAMELESGLGGVYSRLGLDLQRPLALWSLRLLKITILGRGVTPIVITGLDALSRAADLENLRGFLSDVVQVGTLPPEIQGRLVLAEIFRDIAAGWGVQSTKYIKDEEQYQQEVQAQQEAQRQHELNMQGGQPE